MFFYKLKNMREDKDLSQQQISNILGIDQRVYSNYELGKRTISIDHLITLAKYYNTSIDYLVNLTDNSDPYPHKLT